MQYYNNKRSDIDVQIQLFDENDIKVVAKPLLKNYYDFGWFGIANRCLFRALALYLII